MADCRQAFCDRFSHFLVAVSQSTSVAYILNAYLEGKGQQNDLAQREVDLQSKCRQTAWKGTGLRYWTIWMENYELSIY